MASDPKIQPIFYGEFRHTIDDKKRITIPASWRDEKQEEFFLVPNHELHCLTIMPPDVFRQTGSQLESNSGKEKYRLHMRRFYGQARNIKIDKQGRLLLPEDYCERIALRGEAVLSGVLDRFEIWNPTDWDKFSDAEADEEYAAVMRKVL